MTPAIVAPVGPVSMPFPDYLGIEAEHWSALKELRVSPLHYRHRKTHPLKDTPALRMGRAVHTATLEPDLFPRQYAIRPEGIDRRTKAGKEEWIAFEEANAGRTVLGSDDYDRCLAIRDAVRAHPIARAYLEGGFAEQSIEWTDVETGVHCKGRVDWISHSRPALVDLKTARAIGERDFGNAIVRMGYHCQGALYSDGWQAVTREDLDFVFIAVESAAPHDVRVIRLSDADRSLGQAIYRQLLARKVECERTGIWPGAFPEQTDSQLPAWADPEYDGDGEWTVKESEAA